MHEPGCHQSLSSVGRRSAIMSRIRIGMSSTALFLLVALSASAGDNEPAKPKRPVPPAVQQLLERQDRDKDGKVSREEARGPLAQQFDLLDTNKDGFLDRKELRRAAERLIAMRRANPAKGGPAAADAGRTRLLDFDAFDKD